MYHLITIFLLVTATVIEGQTRHVIYWDYYQTPELAYKGIEVDVNVNEYMDILCPYELGPARWKHRANTRLHIFNVTLEGFLECNTSKGNRLQLCDTPELEKKLTTKFQVRSPSPLGFKFIPGSSYYYISKPLGEESKGCSKETLKMRINVRGIGEEPTRRHHEKTRTYHTIKTDHRNVSKIAGLHPVFRNKPSVQQPKRHHHHQKNTKSTTRDPKEFKKVAEPVIRASQGPNKDGGNAASSLRNNQRTFTSLMTLVISTFGTLVTCALLTDFELLRSTRP